MPPAARITDPTSHVEAGAKLGVAVGPPTGALQGAGMPTVLIEGRPAAVVGPGTMNGCNVPPQHRLLGPANVILPGPEIATRRVLVGGRPIAAVGDKTACKAVVSGGARTVLIGGR
ncbi:PAAR domain-containing protein [Amycolatopsis samaneae]|uniref:Zn-binding Pro-Ala-Ala-Arg (PAAR) domain-containing protein, incolved in TypeVI secretion n=1 Tax=Amycolatopsis samaneae TaxID=664691 RepID=A0ABW5GSF2_9PSEU